MEPPRIIAFADKRKEAGTRWVEFRPDLDGHGIGKIKVRFIRNGYIIVGSVKIQGVSGKAQRAIVRHRRICQRRRACAKPRRGVDGHVVGASDARFLVVVDGHGERAGHGRSVAHRVGGRELEVAPFRFKLLSGALLPVVAVAAVMLVLLPRPARLRKNSCCCQCPSAALGWSMSSCNC